MYTVSDAVEMGEAHKLVLSIRKPAFMCDDAEPQSCEPEDYFDE